jgi:hypothetical protein
MVARVHDGEPLFSRLRHRCFSKMRASIGGPQRGFELGFYVPEHWPHSKAR